jgi:hypothetical protein
MVEASKIKEYARQRVEEITESLESLIENFESDLTKQMGANSLS